VQESRKEFMHPPENKLRDFVDQKSSSLEIDEIKTHLSNCEICREYCEEYKILAESLAGTAEMDLPEKAKRQATEIYQRTISPNIIPLYPLIQKVKDQEVILAADGSQEEGEEPKNVVTLYSEDPELILRIIHDSVKDTDFVQLISDDRSLLSNVLLELPDLEREVVTDHNGRATIEGIPPQDYEKLKWQVKLPEASFSLKPLTHDPEKTEYTSETVLETENKDKISVAFEGKTEGKQICIKIIALSGNENFGPVKVVVSQGDDQYLSSKAKNKFVVFDISDKNDPITVRLFH
jgi:hypothetical protein